MSFLKKKAPVLTINTLIGEGAVLTGDLMAEKNVKIDGRVTGNVETQGDIVLADTAVVEGGLVGQDVYIEGEVSGSVRAQGNLVLGETARIGGDLCSRSLVADDGAVFRGKSTLLRDGEEIPVRKQEDSVPLQFGSGSRRSAEDRNAGSRMAETARSGLRRANTETEAERQAPQVVKMSVQPQEQGEIANVTVRTLSTSDQLHPDEPPKSRPMTEEEEKEAFLRAFYASTTPKEE